MHVEFYEDPSNAMDIWIFGMHYINIQELIRMQNVLTKMWGSMSD